MDLSEARDFTHSGTVCYPYVFWWAYNATELTELCKQKKKNPVRKGTQPISFYFIDNKTCNQPVFWIIATAILPMISGTDLSFDIHAIQKEKKIKNHDKMFWSFSYQISQGL